MPNQDLAEKEVTDIRARETAGIDLFIGAIMFAVLISNGSAPNWPDPEKFTFSAVAGLFGLAHLPRKSDGTR